MRNLVKFDSREPIILRNSFFKDDFFTKLEEFTDSIMNSFFKEYSNSIVVTDTGYPKVNIIEKDNVFVIEASVPGITKDNLKVIIKDHTLKIIGGKRIEDVEKNDKYVCRELKCSSFSRSFIIDNLIDESKISCKIENGLLIINLPKKIESIQTAKDEEKYTEILIE